MQQMHSFYGFELYDAIFMSTKSALSYDFDAFTTSVKFYTANEDSL